MSRGQSHECIDRTGLTRRDLLARLAGVAALPVAAMSCGRGLAAASVSQVTNPLHYSSLADVGKLIAARQLQSLDLTRQLLDRIAAVDGRLQSYVTIMADQALASARRADTEITRRPVPRASPWRAHRGERPLLYARRSHHGGYEGLCRLRARFRRDRRRAAESCGCGDPGQARSVRRCVRSVLSRPAGAGEPVGQHTVERRVVEWLRRGDGSGLVLCVGRYGHGRARSGTHRPRTAASGSSRLTAE